METEAAGFPGLMLLKPIVPLLGRHRICSIEFVRKGMTYLPDFVFTGWPKRESIGTSTVCNLSRSMLISASIRHYVFADRCHGR